MQPSLVPRLADTVLMVRPVDFRFNDETRADNEFQDRPRRSPAEIRTRAAAEFDGMVGRLREEGVTVLVLEKDPEAAVETPDAVFPNNWLSTEHGGALLSFPMLAPNRRAERRVDAVANLLRRQGYQVSERVEIGDGGPALEGTGSLVIDHRHGTVYATESRRCDATMFRRFVHARGYRRGLLFRTASSTGRPIYHTNVMMSVGDGLAVVCAESVVDPTERALLLRSLGRHHDVVQIDRDQMEHAFCGNLLQLRDVRDEPLVVMSRTAHDGFTPAQRRRLRQHGRLLPVDIPTIEAVGGGSARCMLAEIFLPRSTLAATG